MTTRANAGGARALVGGGSSGCETVFAGAPRSIDPLLHLSDRAPAVAKLESLLGQLNQSSRSRKRQRAETLPALLSAPAGAAPAPPPSATLSAPIQRSERRRTTSHARRSMSLALRAKPIGKKWAIPEAQRPREHRRKPSFRRALWQQQGDQFVRAAFLGERNDAADDSSRHITAVDDADTGAGDTIALPSAATSNIDAPKRRLTSHDWHAKRFEMVERWGHILPQGRRDAGFKAALRWASEGCVAHDASYWMPLLLSAESAGPDAPSSSASAPFSGPIAMLLSKLCDHSLLPSSLTAENDVVANADADAEMGESAVANGNRGVNESTIAPGNDDVSASITRSESRAAKARRRRATARRKFKQAQPSSAAAEAASSSAAPAPAAPTPLTASASDDAAASTEDVAAPEQPLDIHSPFSPPSLAGSYEAQWMLHEPGAFPRGAIGPVKSTWLDPGALLLWSHASYFSDAVAALVRAGASVRVSSVADAAPFSSSSSSLASSSVVSITPLASQLCRFSLCGVKATQALQRLIVPVGTSTASQSATAAAASSSASSSSATELGAASADSATTNGPASSCTSLRSGWAVDPRFTGAMAGTAAAASQPGLIVPSALSSRHGTAGTGPSPLAALTSPPHLAALSSLWPGESLIAAWRQRHNREGMTVKDRLARAEATAAGSDAAIGSTFEEGLSPPQAVAASSSASATAPSATANNNDDASIRDGFGDDFLALPSEGLRPASGAPAVSSSSAGASASALASGSEGPAKRAKGVATADVSASFQSVTSAAIAASSSSTSSATASGPSSSSAKSVRPRMNRPSPPLTAMGAVPWPWMLVNCDLNCSSSSSSNCSSSNNDIAKPSTSSALSLSSSSPSPPLPLPMSSRWDLVLPSSAAPAVWAHIVTSSKPGLCGAQAVGLAEWAALCAARGEHRVPQDFPDTDAAASTAELEAEEAFAHFINRPRSKRINYGALRIAAPFKPRWELLWKQPATDPATVAEGIGSTDAGSDNNYEAPANDTDSCRADITASLSVVRGRSFVAAFIKPQKPPTALDSSSSSPSDDLAATPLPSLTPAPTLLRVRLTMWEGGWPHPGSVLCAPQRDDLLGWAQSAGVSSCGSDSSSSSADFAGSSQWLPLMEPPGAGCVWPVKTKSLIQQAAVGGGLEPKPSASGPAAAAAPLASPAAAPASASAPSRSQEDGLLTLPQYMTSVLQPALTSSPPGRLPVGYVTSGVYDHYRTGMPKNEGNAGVGVGFIRCEAAGWLIAQARAVLGGGAYEALLAQAQHSCDALHRAATPSGCVEAQGTSNSCKKGCAGGACKCACSASSSFSSSSSSLARVGRPLLVLLRIPTSAQYRLAVAEVLA